MIKLTNKQKVIILFILLIMISVISYYIFLKTDFNTEELELTAENEINSSNLTETKEEKDDYIMIHITGEVQKEGIIKIEEGARIIDVIEAAGGLTEKAYTKEVNFAYIVKDGQKIYIPSIDDKKETEEMEYITEENGDNIVIDNFSENKKGENSVMVNINKATQTELEELQGIGPSTALKIIEYRNENGKFNSIEDIKNVPRNWRCKI